jgi:arylformamidase
LIENYPPQEPFTSIGAKYHTEVLRRGEAVRAIEVAYGRDPYQRLAVVPADRPNGDVLVVFHGGGWTNGYKEWMLFMAPALTARGVTFVSAGYRLAPKHIFPEGYHDSLDAIAAAHGSVSQWGGDPGRLFVGGHSAGGHLAALAAVRQDWQASRNLSAHVIRGALPISGTYRFGDTSGLSMRPRFLGPPENGAEPAASPIQHVHRDAPPFLIAYGEKDFPHLREQADEFATVLRTAGIGVVTKVLAGCDHLGASYCSGDPEGDWLDTAATWMRRQ